VRARQEALPTLSTAAAVLVLAWLYLEDAPVRLGLDTFHHLASVRELARGEFPPRHNLVEGYVPQGHYGPYLVAVATLARWTHASPRMALYVAGLGGLLAFVLAFRAVALRLVGPDAARWSAPAALLLSGPWPSRWGPVPGLGWPGTTSIADAQNFFFPQHAGLVLLLVLLALLLPPRPGAASGLRPWRVAAAVVTAGLLVASHPLTGLPMAAALAAMLLSELLTSRPPPARLALLAALPALGVALAALWPYYPLLELLKAFTMPQLWEPPRAASASGPPYVAMAFLPGETVLASLRSLGPAAAGLVWCFVLSGRRQPYLLLWTGLDLLLAAAPIPFHQRFLIFAVLPLQIAATGLLQAAWKRGVTGRALALALLLAGAASAGERIAWTLDREPPRVEFLSRFTPEDAVILSDPTTSSAVAGLTGRKVVAADGPDVFLVMAGGWQRMLDTRRFLSWGTPPEERAAILARWHVTHVLVDTLRMQGSDTLPDPKAYEGGGYVLYDVRGPTTVKSR
jgi:hypothetical protein